MAIVVGKDECADPQLRCGRGSHGECRERRELLVQVVRHDQHVVAEFFCSARKSRPLPPALRRAWLNGEAEGMHEGRVLRGRDLRIGEWPRWRRRVAGGKKPRAAQSVAPISGYQWGEC